MRSSARALFVFLPLLFAACGSKDSTTTPVPNDAAVPEDTAVQVEHEEPCGDAPKVGATPTPSTRVATLKPKKSPLSGPGKVNPVNHDAMVGYLKDGLGDIEAGPGETGSVNDALMPGAGSSVGKAGRKSIAFIAALSDTQLADDESPNRVLAFDTPTAPGAGRPQEGGVAQATSAMHRTLAAIAKARPFDFEVITGDCIDSTQQNEIDWFVQLMDGGKGLHTDSGDDDDPVIGPNNDWKDPFDPVAAPAPWYFVFGNHDVEIQGTSIFDEGSIQTAVGTEPKGGTRDYRKKYAPVTRDSVPADPRRKPIGREEIIAALQKTASTPGPVGHGFKPGGGATPANFVVDPMPGVPLRLVQLDTNDPFGGSDGLVYQKTIDEFLEPTLAKADADGVMVIMASHHATTNIDVGKGLDSTPVPGAVAGDVVAKAVAKHPSVILWLVGHNHENRIRTVPGPSADAPGYYEIMTSAIADWPSQSRAIELVFNPDANSLSIFTSMIDFEARTCLEARFRTWSLVDVSSAWSPSGAGKETDRNVELVRALPKNVKLAGIGKDKIETETTLVGK